MGSQSVQPKQAGTNAELSARLHDQLSSDQSAKIIFNNDCIQKFLIGLKTPGHVHNNIKNVDAICYILQL